jgi:hypothetical protein
MKMERTMMRNTGIRICGILALLAVATGCQSPHIFAQPDRTWKSHVGQLKHTNDQRTLVGDVVVQQRGVQEFQLDFLKGGSFPLLSLRQDANVSRAEGLLASGHWQGSPEKAPKPLRPWLGLRAFLAKANSASPLIYEQEGQRFEFQFVR